MADVRELETSSPKFSVVGIGASAGGITALQTLFASVPATRNLAFVVMQHLLSEQPSHLARLFRAWTPMSVREAHNGVVIEAGCVYITPPGQVLGLDQGTFTTRPLDRLTSHNGIDTIDLFFESLADEVMQNFADPRLYTEAFLDKRVARATIAKLTRQSPRKLFAGSMMRIGAKQLGRLFGKEPVHPMVSAE